MEPNEGERSYIVDLGYIKYSWSGDPRAFFTRHFDDLAEFLTVGQWPVPARELRPEADIEKESKWDDIEHSYDDVNKASPALMEIRRRNKAQRDMAPAAEEEEADEEAAEE